MEHDDSKLSKNAQYLIKLCKQIIKDVRSGACTEEEINDFIARTEPRNHGYINPRDYLSADEGIKYLKVHRNQFFALLKQHEVQVTKINNQPIGYHIKSLDKIKATLNL